MFIGCLNIYQRQWCISMSRLCFKICNIISKRFLLVCIIQQDQRWNQGNSCILKNKELFLLFLPKCISIKLFIIVLFRNFRSIELMLLFSLLISILKLRLKNMEILRLITGLDFLNSSNLSLTEFYREILQRNREVRFKIYFTNNSNGLIFIMEKAIFSCQLL